MITWFTALLMVVKTVRHRAKASFRFRARRRSRQGGNSRCGWSIGRTGLLHTMQSFVKITLNAHVLCRISHIGSTPLKPSLAITKRTNLKLLEESAADDTVPTSVEEGVTQPTSDDNCQDSRADSFQSVSVQTLVRCFQDIDIQAISIKASSLGNALFIF
ncbi:uncharacterized protein LOC143248939 [Tachypleus tridentatus]|uniref:uncharacterized protein LOC143248939 n=1 Tax=Tachypleus tridentatus TaxID=6853 RepID=UPI003FD41C44